MSKKVVVAVLAVGILAGAGYFQWNRIKQIKIADEKKRIDSLSVLFDRAHLVAYSELKDLAAIKKIYGLPKDKALVACLQKKGKKCKSKARAPEAWKGPRGEYEGNFNLLGARCGEGEAANCVVKRATLTKLFCPNDRECASVEIMFSSEYTGKEKIKARRSLLAITPNQLLK